MDRTAMITALRHAPPVRTGLCAGRFELPVMEIGAALDSLTQELHERGIRRVYGSPSLRCANLATLLAQRLGLSMQLDERLLELDFGQWEGRDWNEITCNDGDRFAAWSSDWQRGAPPGGESVPDLERRVATFLADAPHDPVLVVTHAGPIRAMRVVVQSEGWEQAMQRAVPYLVPLSIPEPECRSTDPV